MEIHQSTINVYIKGIIKVIHVRWAPNAGKSFAYYICLLGIFTLVHDSKSQQIQRFMVFSRFWNVLHIHVFLEENVGIPIVWTDK